MRTLSKLLLALAAVAAFSLAQSVEAKPALSGLPERVPDGGLTISLLGFALLGVAALRRKLNR